MHKKHLPIFASVVIGILILVSFVILAGRSALTTPNRLFATSVEKALASTEINYVGKLTLNSRANEKITHAYFNFDGIAQPNKTSLVFLADVNGEISAEEGTDKKYGNGSLTLKSTKDQISFRLEQFLLPETLRANWQKLLARFQERWYALPLELASTNFGTDWQTKMQERLLASGVVKFARTETKPDEYLLTGTLDSEILRTFFTNVPALEQLITPHLAGETQPKIEIRTERATKLPRELRISIENTATLTNCLLEMTFDYSARQTKIAPLTEPVEFDPRVLHF